MMQFLKWILFGNTNNKNKELSQSLAECRARIDELENQNRKLTHTIEDLSTCVSAVASATQLLAQDVNAIAVLVSESSKKKLDDPFSIFGRDDDDDGYLH